MLRHLTSKIKATGPITVAEYMREVLTNPVTVSLICLHPHPDLNINKNDVCNDKKGSLRLAARGRQRRCLPPDSVHGASVLPLICNCFFCGLICG